MNEPRDAAGAAHAPLAAAPAAANFSLLRPDATLARPLDALRPWSSRHGVAMPARSTAM